jgi:hypothetical protein
MLDLIMEDVRMIGAIFADSRQLREITRRLRVGQQGDARARHHDATRNATNTRSDFTMNSRTSPL